MPKCYLILLVCSAIPVSCLYAQKTGVRSTPSISTARAPNDSITTVNGETYKVERWKDINEPVSGKFRVLKKPALRNTASFTGLSRIAAKTTFANQNTYQPFTKIRDIFRKYRLPSDSAMMLVVTRKSPRMNIENRGVILRTAWLFAFKKQRDNDYHLIVGDNPVMDKAYLMTMEISGLPKKRNAVMSKARADFIKALGINDSIAMGAYFVFTVKPVPVHIEGSLFYDVDHQGGNVGPVKGKFRMKLRTAWEIHPITLFRLR